MSSPSAKEYTASVHFLIVIILIIISYLRYAYPFDETGSSAHDIGDPDVVRSQQLRWGTSTPH